MRNKLLLILGIITVLSCSQKNNKNITAQHIVDKAIEKSGKSTLSKAELKFDFRGKTYASTGDCNNITLKRIQIDQDESITDILKPNGKFTRYVNDRMINIADSLAFKHSESINSVHYFVQLPYRLNDNAVQKTYLGIDTINDKAYHKVKVNFKKEGGGTDYQDEYLYWFGYEDFKLNFLAYSFTVNGGGIRFREAYNERYIKGIRFVDYKNYKPISKKTSLEDISKAYQNDQLELLSKIENTNISVEVTSDKC